MGADFLVQYVTAPKGESPNWEAITNKIDALADKPQAEWSEEAAWLFENEDGAEWGEFAKNHVAVLHKDIAKLKDIWEGGYTREGAMLTIGGEDVLMTGGQSWGDSPTELFETISRLYDAEVL